LGWPNPNAESLTEPHDPNQNRSSRSEVTEAKLMAESTAVKGGGIVRAIIPKDRWSEFGVFDAMAYNDPNGECADEARSRVIVRADASDSPHVARWWYVRRTAGTAIQGWIPYRSPNTTFPNPQCNGTIP
jgi:hypothetical protein